MYCPSCCWFVMDIFLSPKRNVSVAAKVKRLPEKLNNIFIGSKVFISSGVEIYGPAIISDETFVGSKTMIIIKKALPDLTGGGVLGRGVAGGSGWGF